MTQSNQISATDIAAQFSHSQQSLPRLSTATSKPNFTSIFNFQDKLIENASSIPLNDTDLGHLALVINPTDYTAANRNTAFIAPTDPGLNPTHDANSTGAQIVEDNRIHAEQTRNYKTYQATKVLLRNMIINSIDDMYINTLKHRITKYSTIEPLDLINHLKATYGMITIDDLTENTKRMTIPWNPPTPIEDLWTKLKDGQEFSNEGGENIPDSQLIRLAYENISNTGLFTSACKKWRQKPAVNHTYDNLKLHFTTEVEDYERHRQTSSSQGYANSTEQIQEVVHQELQNILTQHNPELFQLPTTQEVPIVEEAPTQHAANSTEEVIAELRNLVNNLTNNNTTNNATRTTDRRNNRTNNRNANRNANSNRRQPLTAQGLDDAGIPITYCWSHGITSNLRHCSMTCRHKKEGHKDNSTLTDKMGGSTHRCLPTNA